MAYKKISLDYEGQVAVLKLNDPSALNAVGPEMLEELRDAVGTLGSNKTARCLLLTGEGRGFCAGANLADPSAASSPDITLRGGYHPLFLQLRDLDMAIVTAVNGAAAGVGMSLALMGDMVCASKNAFFLQAFARIGLIPDGGSTYMLPRLVGRARAIELSMLAERLPAEKAQEWGLINRLYEDPDSLMAGAMELATQLSLGPKSLSLIRKAYWATWDNSYEQQLDLEARLQGEANNSKDAAEGVAAFLEKRDARFQGE